jgi:hypothetical protein
MENTPPIPVFVVPRFQRLIAPFEPCGSNGSGRGYEIWANRTRRNYSYHPAARERPVRPRKNWASRANSAGALSFAMLWNPWTMNFPGRLDFRQAFEFELVRSRSVRRILVMPRNARVRLAGFLKLEQ